MNATLRSIFLPGRSVRCFGSTRVASSKTAQISKLARNLDKLVHGTGKRKKKPGGGGLPTATSIANPAGQPGKTGGRRLEVLNKLFMRHVTDQMTVGEFGERIAGLSLEISKVNVSPDYQYLRIYWTSRGGILDLKTQEALDRIRSPLRHELSQLRLMGEVPRIVFVKDTEFSKITEVELRLKVADFGEDYEPTESMRVIKSEFTVNKKLDPKVIESIKKLEIEDDIEEVTMPKISQNIFGLDRDAIMNRITTSMNKSKDSWSGTVRSYSNSEADYSINKTYQDISDERIELQEYLRKRQIEQMKVMKSHMKKDRQPKDDVDDEEDDAADETIDTDAQEDTFVDYYENEENFSKT